MNKTITKILAVIGAITAAAALIYLFRDKIAKLCESLNCKKNCDCDCNAEELEDCAEEAVEEVAEEVKEDAEEIAQAIEEEFKDYADVTPAE